MLNNLISRLQLKHQHSEDRTSSVSRGINFLSYFFLKNLLKWYYHEKFKMDGMFLISIICGLTDRS